MECFHQFHRDRHNRLGGGIALYVREGINAKEVYTNLVLVYVELMWVQLQTSDPVRLRRDIFNCVLYSPPW